MMISKGGTYRNPPEDITDYEAIVAHLNAYTRQLGSQAMILTEWTNTSGTPAIAMGSYISHGGVLYVVASEEAVSLPVSDGTYYLKVAASGESLALSWVSDISGYAWNAIYNGLYHADESQVLPYCLVMYNGILDKCKITNLMQRYGYTGVDKYGEVDPEKINQAIITTFTSSGTYTVTENKRIKICVIGGGGGGGGGGGASNISYNDPGSGGRPGSSGIYSSDTFILDTGTELAITVGNGGNGGSGGSSGKGDDGIQGSESNVIVISTSEKLIYGGGGGGGSGGVNYGIASVNGISSTPSERITYYPNTTIVCSGGGGGNGGDPSSTIGGLGGNAGGVGGNGGNGGNDTQVGANGSNGIGYGAGGGGGGGSGQNGLIGGNGGNGYSGIVYIIAIKE